MTIVWPYMLRYRVEAERVIILHTRHGAQLGSREFVSGSKIAKMPWP